MRCCCCASVCECFVSMSFTMNSVLLAQSQVPSCVLGLLAFSFTLSLASWAISRQLARNVFESRMTCYATNVVNHLMDPLLIVWVDIMNFALMAFWRAFAQETNLIHHWSWNGRRRCVAQMHATVMHCEKVSPVLLRVFANFIKYNLGKYVPST